MSREFCLGGFLSGEFLLGGFCWEVYVWGFFVWGVFVLEPKIEAFAWSTLGTTTLKEMNVRQVIIEALAWSYNPT